MTTLFWFIGAIVMFGTMPSANPSFLGITGASFETAKLYLSTMLDTNPTFHRPVCASFMTTLVSFGAMPIANPT